MADRHTTSPLCNSDSDIWSIEGPSHLVQNQNVNMNAYKLTCVTYSTSDVGCYNGIRILCIAWLV